MTTILDYQWAFSTITKATLQGSSAYTLTNFAKQSDQVSAMLYWDIPQREGTERPRPNRLAGNLDDSVRADAGWFFTWCMMPMTPGQFAYVMVNQFSSGALWSAPGTFQTWDDEVNNFSCFQGTILRPVPGQDYDIKDTMYMNVKYKVVGAIKL